MRSRRGSRKVPGLLQVLGSTDYRFSVTLVQTGTKRMRINNERTHNERHMHGVCKFVGDYSSEELMMDLAPPTKQDSLDVIN